MHKRLFGLFIASPFLIPSVADSQGLMDQDEGPGSLALAATGSISHHLISSSDHQ